MALITCPRCGTMTKRAGYPLWQILIAIFFFPLGLLAFLAGRKPTVCQNCGNAWQA